MLSTRKAQELDVVELTEDLPGFGLKKGEIGAVVAVLDSPDEAYDLEFVDKSGKSKFAYAVKPNQIQPIDDLAKSIFEGGIILLHQGNLLDAEREFRKACRLQPDYLSILHNSIVKSFEGKDEPQKAITAMFLVFNINPDYKTARGNLAIAFQKYGIQKLNEGKIDDGIELFQMALTLEPPEEILSDIKISISAVFTDQAIRKHEEGQLFEALQLMKQANIVDPNEQTRRNVGIAYLNLAKTFLDNGQFGDATVTFHRAELTGVMSVESLNDYGVALAQMGEVKMAISVFERALDLSPNSEIVQENLEILRSGRARALSKVTIDAEFTMNHRDDNVMMKEDSSMPMPVPTYSINVRNFASL